MDAAPGVKTCLDFPIPNTMKAWILRRSRRIKASRKPVTVPSRAEVLVRIDAVSICAADLEIIDHGARRLIQGGMPFNKISPPVTNTWAQLSRSGPGSTNTTSASASPWRFTPVAVSADVAGKACIPRAIIIDPTMVRLIRVTVPTASRPTGAFANTRSTTSTRWLLSLTPCRMRKPRWWSPPARRCTG